MSALPPIADIRQCRWDVRYVPVADIHVNFGRPNIGYQMARAPRRLTKTFFALARARDKVVA